MRGPPLAGAARMPSGPNRPYHPLFKSSTSDADNGCAYHRQYCRHLTVSESRVRLTGPVDGIACSAMGSDYQNGIKVLPSRPAFTDPAADRLRPLLGFCHLEGSDQPFETQLQTAWVSFGKQMRVAFAGPEGGSTELVRRGFSRAGRVKEPPGGFHQVDGLAAGTPEPPLEITSSRPRLRRLRVGLMDDGSAQVTTGLSSVVDLERLGAVATRIAAAAPERTIPTGSLHRGGATHPFPAASSATVSPDKSHQTYLTADCAGSKYPQEPDGVQCQISNFSPLRQNRSGPERCLSVSPGSMAGSSTCLATNYSKAIFPTS